MNKIVVGERYRLVIRPNPEFTCPNCNVVRGLSEYCKEISGQVVTVIRDSSSGVARCFHCGTFNPNTVGMYGIDSRLPNGDWHVVPYTWLQPLDAPYDALAAVQP